MQQDSSRQNGSSSRGFASMDRTKQREIASQGGRASHQKGTAHEFTPEEARAAGRKGGEVVSRDRAHMAQIGREGGRASHSGRHARRSEPPAAAKAEAQGDAQAQPATDNHDDLHVNTAGSSDTN